MTHSQRGVLYGHTHFWSAVSPGTSPRSKGTRSKTRLTQKAIVRSHKALIARDGLDKGQPRKVVGSSPRSVHPMPAAEAPGYEHKAPAGLELALGEGFVGLAGWLLARGAK